MHSSNWCKFILVLVLLAGFSASGQEVPKNGQAAANPNDPNFYDGYEYADFYIHYAAVLEDYVDEDGLVNYDKLRRHRIELFPQALEFENLSLDDLDSWPKNEQKAFWINAYNYFTLLIVTKNYPIQSTRYQRLWWPGDCIMHIEKFYDGQYVKIMNTEYTLNEIEQILIEDFDDPRVLLAISKATLLSPPIMQTPYYGKSLELQLRQQIQAYLSSNIVFDYDHEKDILVIPEVFQLQSELFQKYYTNNKRFRVYEPTMHSAFNFIYELGDDKDRALLERISSDTEIKFKRRRWRYYMKLNESEK
jgi:hypothetical protein